ncbi:putative FmdB family regulatory protein [Geodermatophilus bullaregiensis]|uniref:FmdB family zinc ribbon protein n=1 Tax=Geodermatophilus bullaregiensis TaxID=1564160 RepID=UPI00195C5FB0|nr:FmdB family zinc ribbon protein [Geodermatophilus bullaregiensis]MBM7808284.1 putative FmdB family regulatory protein [Geodermatophilus bullaregiensis]
MAVYQYRCADHGLLEVARPIGTAADREPCPTCAAPASRVLTAPRLSLGSARNRALIDRTRRTADAPAVVPAPPPSRPAARAANPALARLPRP